MNNQNHLIKLTKQILDKGYLFSLATVDEKGVWVADVIYSFDGDLNIYWLSKDFRRHSKAIELDKNVAGTITITKSMEDEDEGLQISGEAQKVSEVPKVVIDRYFKKRKQDVPSLGEGVFKEHIWYKLTPELIELIYSKEFGYNRQTVK